MGTRIEQEVCVRVCVWGCDIDLNSILTIRGDVLTRGHRYKLG